MRRADSPLLAICKRMPDSWCRFCNADKIIRQSIKFDNPTLHGAIAQLGERIVRNDEVVGSIPTSSTIFSITCATFLKITFNLTSSYWNTRGTLGTDRST